MLASVRVKPSFAFLSSPHSAFPLKTENLPRAMRDRWQIVQTFPDKVMCHKFLFRATIAVAFEEVR